MATCTRTAWRDSSGTLIGGALPLGLRLGLDLGVVAIGELPHVRAEPLVFVGDRIEEEALDEVRAAVVLVHLVDQVIDLLHHVLERPLEAVAARYFLEERLDHRQQVAIEQDVVASGRLDDPHGWPPKLFTAVASSGC